VISAWVYLSQKVQHGAGSVELRFERICAEPEPPAGALHHCAVWCGFAAHEKRDANDALLANDSNLGRRAVLQDVQQRDDGGGREVHVTERHTGLVQDMAERQVHMFELGQPPLQFSVGKRREQTICSGVKDCDHLGPHTIPGAGDHEEDATTTTQ
jgi:hypothetical protein